jgi:hypothetical protein
MPAEAARLMRFARQLALLGFVIGFGGPVLYYETTPPFFPYQSSLVCPWCPFVTPDFGPTLAWLSAGLRLGVLSGIVIAIAAYTVGYMVALIRRTL